VRALLRHDAHTNYYLYFRHAGAEDNALWVCDAPNLTRRVVPLASANLRNQVLAYHLYRDRIQLFHSPGFFLPYAWVGPKVVSIHDVNFLRHARHWWRPGKRGAFLSLLAQTALSARVSARVLTVSQSAAQDIQRYLRVRASKIAVVPNGVRTTLKPSLPPVQVADMLHRYQLEDYMLFVGVISPTKNLERLVRAFASAAARRAAATPGARAPKLVLAGKSNSPYTDRVLRPLVSSLGCEREVVLTGYVPEDDLNALYLGARCVAQVSEGEGFGLPIVEAMHCGAPVITSTIAATAEVAGDAALLVDPTDTAAIAEALSRLCEDEALRLALRERGFRRAQTFTWDRAAQLTLAAYRGALGAP
jgi:glycosyltransferase involved in cell wall biosynthesis